MPSIDLRDLDLFAKGAPYEVFARLRRDAPVHWNQEDDGPGFWNLTRHADVVAVNQDSVGFSSAERGIMIFDPDSANPRAPMMIEMDPPLHTRYRGLVNRAFTPRRVAALAGFATKLVESIIEDALTKRNCDFVRDVAAKLPLQIILEMMGVDPAQRSPFFDLANRVIGFSDPEFGEPEEGENVAAQAEMAVFARRLAEEKTLRPADDLASELLAVEIDGEKLTPNEFDLFFMLLITAGSETTRSAISRGVLAFHQFPDQWQRLLDDRSLLPSAIEEILRYAAPIHHFRRTATSDIEIRGTRIRAGDKVVVWYTSANRDEDVFEVPDAFDVARSPNEHVSFGFGRHFCLGASLARLELRVMLEAFLARDVVAEPAGAVEYMRSNFAHSIKRMPVNLRARA
jgi:cytochrome P450